MWDDYTVPGGTYRENLLNTPGRPHVPDGHPAASFRYSALKEKYGLDNGDILIDRQAEEKLSESASTPVAEPEKLEKPVATTVEVSA